MDFFESEHYKYKSNNLYCENVNLDKIANTVNTPTYVYSKKFMTDQFRLYQNAFKNISHKIFYACKANYNINIIKLFNDLGAGIDVNSMGEFLRAKKAGASPSNMIMSGVGKTKEEIELAISNNISLIKAESLGEILLINRIAENLNRKAPLAIRVNPNVDPETHPYISTGLAENKFGIDESSAIKIFEETSTLQNIDIVGIDMHIGSQITQIEPYVEAIKKLVTIISHLKKKNVIISHLDIGGGMGIKYLNETPFTPDDLAKAIVPILEKTDCEVYIEPGRSLTANGGCLLTEVLYTKTNLEKNFIVVDAAMNDLLRPSIYKAYHHIQPVIKSNENDYVADIVGPVCESGDFLGKGITIQKSKMNELLAVMSAGAYGMVMSSNYNARRRPAEVLVDGDKFHIIRARETYEQLIENETLIDFNN